MTDEIIDCIVYKKIDDDTIVRYKVVYSVEDHGNTAELTVTIDSADMTDSTDMDELKTLANAKATTAKATWITNIGSDQYETLDNSIRGNITL